MNQQTTPQNTATFQYIPAQGAQEPSSYRATYLPALLAGIVTVAGVAIKQQQNKLKTLHGANPIGIINTDGICYLAACIQMLDAMKTAKGEQFTAAITDGPDIIGAYSRWRSDQADTRYIESNLATDPQEIIDAWVAHKPDHYIKHAVVKKVATRAGTKKNIIIPSGYTNGTGGRPQETFNHIMATYDARCTAGCSTNPCSSTIRFASGAYAQVNILKYTAVTTTEHEPKKFDPEQSLGAQILTAPELLILEEQEHSSHTMPLYFSIVTPDHIRHTYRLLSAIYCLPVQIKDTIFGHAIAIARHHNTWYSCDNHIITQIGSGDDLSALAWIETQACTSYEGKGFPLDTVEPMHVPHVICYEKIAMDNQTRSSQRSRKKDHVRPCYDAESWYTA